MSGRGAQLADGLRWAGLGAMLAALAVRALATSGELPGWELDPTIIAARLGGVGPAWSLGLDAAAVIGAGLALVGEALSGRRVRAGVVALAAVGCLVVVWHGWVSAAGTLGDRRVGAAWGAAMLAGVACWHLCREERMRRVAAAVVLGMVAVLAVKGAQDVLIAHPRTVAQFEENRELFLAAQGWSAESPMARSYERRLMQREASGWFGLTNVYASLAAAAWVGMLVLVVGGVARGEGQGGRVRVLGIAGAALGLVAAVAALGMSMAKGGVFAAGAGVMGATALAAAVWFGGGVGAAQRVGRVIGGVVAAAAVVGPLALVVVRGVIGEGMGDRSLLFRWFYMQGAARVMGERPLLGVGPDGFQAAYLVAKNPISPEDVRSPHSLLLDWGATLGLVGVLAWGALFLWWVWGAATGPSRAAAALPEGRGEGAGGLRTELRAAGLIAAAAMLLAAFIDRAHATPDVALARFVGLIAWAVVAWGVVAAGRGAVTLSVALAGAALALAAHGQIEVTPTLPASVGLFMVVIAAAAAPWGGGATGDGGGGAGRWRRLAPGSVLVAAGALLGVSSAVPAARWEAALGAAAATVHPIAEANDLVAGIQGEGDAAARRALQTRLLEHLSSNLNRRVEPSSAGVEGAMIELEVTRLAAGAGMLERAAAMQPGEWRVRREASRLHLRRAAVLGRAGRGDLAREAAERAAGVARGDWEPGVRTPAAGATELAWLGLVYRTMHELTPRGGELELAAGASEAAARLDPYNTELAARLFEVYGEMGREEAALAWGRRALELDDLARLDPEARALTAERRGAIEGVLGAR